MAAGIAWVGPMSVKLPLADSTIIAACSAGVLELAAVPGRAASKVAKSVSSPIGSPKASSTATPHAAAVPPILKG